MPTRRKSACNWLQEVDARTWGKMSTPPQAAASSVAAEAPANWLFSADRVENTPSRAAGVTVDREVRCVGCSALCWALCSALRCVACVCACVRKSDNVVHPSVLLRGRHAVCPASDVVLCVLMPVSVHTHLRCARVVSQARYRRSGADFIKRVGIAMKMYGAPSLPPRCGARVAARALLSCSFIPAPAPNIARTEVFRTGMLAGCVVLLLEGPARFTTRASLCTTGSTCCTRFSRSHAT